MTAPTYSNRPRTEPVDCDPQLVRIRDLIYQIAGIFQPDNKLRSFEDKCEKRMAVVGVATLRDYYDYLTVKPNRQAELVDFLNEITIGETCFFRNQPQLTALRTIVLPKILAARANLPLRHLRIWSAGCSTGEEPYTLSMLLMEELFGQLKGWTFEILATDLNEKSLAHAKAGLYGGYATRNLPGYFQNKYFTGSNDKLAVTPAVKANVSFSRLNLFDEGRVMFMKGLDLIFCCNVLIYFDGNSKKRVIQHFYNNLLSHGYLFLGHSESLYGINEDFSLVHLPSATAYVKSERRKLSQG